MPFGAVDAMQPTGNGLLDSLPADQFARLAASLTRARMAQGATLLGPDLPISAVLFPIAGMVSLVRNMANGDPSEIGVIGREGVVGWPAILSADMGSIVAVVRLPLSAYSISPQALLRFVEAHPDFGQTLARATQALFLQVAQTAACNQHHDIAHRLAKWLLMADDRSNISPIAVTHELLAMMLGVRRAGVTEAMATLRAAGVVGGANGRVAILDRARLEEAACECYAVIRDEALRLSPSARD